jgi:hypothetical protein
MRSEPPSLGVRECVAFTPLSRAVDFASVLADDFIEHGAMRAAPTQNSPQALFGLLDGSEPADHDRNFNSWYVDAFVEHLVGNDRREDAVSKPL